MDTSPIPTDYAQKFAALASVPASDKATAYNNLLDEIITSSASDNLEDNLTAYLAALLGSTRPISGVNSPIDPPTLVASRTLLTAFVTRISALPSNDLQTSLATTALTILQPRVNSFEEQDTSLKLLLATSHELSESFLLSAKTLQTISLDTHATTDSTRAEIWVRTARCYLEEDDAASASVYINRAKNVLHNVTSPPTRLAFALSQARILDAQRSFLDAATAYHTVSLSPLLDESDRLQALSASLTCAILAPAGPARSRTLAKLHRDERAHALDAYSILESMYLDRIILPAEVASFADTLAPHQLARTADGSTVVQRAVLQHNVLGASRLYRNIGVEELGGMLGVDAERAEGYAARMIEQGRVVGWIDGVDGVVYFEGGEGGAAAVNGHGGAGETEGKGILPGVRGANKELRRWDVGVQSLTEEVERITTMIQGQFPDLYEANMVY